MTMYPRRAAGPRRVISSRVTRQFASSLRSEPWVWRTLPTGSSDLAKAANNINNGARKSVFPPEEFEARFHDGRAQVRYIGSPQAQTALLEAPEPAPRPVPLPAAAEAPEARQAPRSTREVDELIAAADHLSFEAGLRSDEMERKGAEAGATFLRLISEQHATYAEALKDLKISTARTEGEE